MKNNLTVGDLKQILLEFPDDFVVSVYDLFSGTRHYINSSDIDFDVFGHFEINIESEVN